ncbi:hypothetical protein K438DRAFT_1750093 [Mycena galopus ATCC 62051]|nr:hypothetical protein K438DRAFT_1750093 [Mycena galopus ATCC 62051]
MSAHLEHLRRRLIQLDVRIVAQRRVLDELQQTRSDVERELHSATATAIYPILTLPAEITTEIFLRFFQVADSWRGDIPAYGASASIVLAGVCRLWRNIALATPVLWSKLKVQIDCIDHGVIRKPGLIEGVIDRWFSRAGLNCPLSLDLESMWEDTPFAPSRLRDIIYRWSHRLQYLRLNIDTTRPLGLDSAAFPLLEVATIGCDPEPDPVIVFRNAPRLHQLCLIESDFLYNQITPRTFTLPWSQLTKFEGNIADFELFTLAPNLVEVACTLTADHGDISGAITHRCLRSFTVMSECGIEFIHQYLTFPALQHLDLSRVSNYDSLESFLARSSPPLVSLSVAACESCFDYWHRYAPLVAGTLENLEFLDLYKDDMRSVFRMLNGVPLPKIQTLSFKDIDDPLNMDGLVKFLYSCHELRTFRFEWRSGSFFDSPAHAGPSDTTLLRDTINGHLLRLAKEGRRIYMGTAKEGVYGSAGDYAFGFSQERPQRPASVLGVKCRRGTYMAPYPVQSIQVRANEIGWDSNYGRETE